MENSAVMCIVVNIFLFPVFICYLFVTSIIFTSIGSEEEAIGDGSRWEAVSYLLSLFSTTGEGFLLCNSDKCRLLSVYVGLAGIALLFTLVAFTAVNLSRMWKSILSQYSTQVSAVPRCILSCILVLTLLVCWFIAFVIIPSLLWWMFGPAPEGTYIEDLSFVYCHYAVFVTVTSVGFGDILMLPVQKMPFCYIFSILSNCFLGSVIAFVVHLLQTCGGGRDRDRNENDDHGYFIQGNNEHLNVTTAYQRYNAVGIGSLRGHSPLQVAENDQVDT